MKRINKYIFFIALLVVSASWHVQAQEISGKVTIITTRINTQVDKRIFTTLQTQLTNLINNRKWTEDNFKQNERIEVNFVLNLDRQVETNVYGASLIIQAGRPVFNTSYNSPIVNWQDNDVTFRYVEFQPVEYNENRISGTDGLMTNLTAIFAFYINIIIGMDYDSFSANGGDPFFKKALFTVNNAPTGRSIKGWTQFDGLRNRYWLAENLMNSRYALMREAINSYYRKSLDIFYEEEPKAREEMMNVLNLLNTFNASNPNTMILQFFMQSKSPELIEMFRKASPEQKNRAIAILEKIDITNASKYREALK
jgi:Domain of unknown function (DUF4835)